MKDIQGYENLYAVTSCGKVWSYRSKKFLKPTLGSTGYLTVKLCKDGVGKTCNLHRLIAQAYIPNPLNLPEVNHKSEIKTENFINNLEWCDKKYNNNYGTHTERQAQKHRKKVYCVELDRVFESQSEAVKELNLPKSGVSNCCKGIQHTTGGYHFKYYEETE